MITVFPVPEATGWTDPTTKKLNILFAVNKSRATISKPKIIEVPKSLLFGLNNFPLSCLLNWIPIRFGVK